MYCHDKTIKYHPYQSKNTLFLMNGKPVIKASHEHRYKCMYKGDVLEFLWV